SIQPFIRPRRGCHRHLSSRGFPQMESEKGQVIRTADGTLLLVHLQTQAPFDDLTDRVHRPPTRALATHDHAEVVCITYESQPTSGQLPVQLVQDDVGKKRG